MATVSISAIFGENGLIKKAQEMKTQQANKISTEEEKLNKLTEEYANVMEGGSGVPEPPADTTGPTVNIEVGTVTDTSIAVTATAMDESGLAENKTYKFYINEEERETNTTGECTFSGLTAATKYTIKVEVKDKLGNLGSATREVTTSVPTISPSTDYTGYYANLDEDPEPEGVIYADLAIGGSGQWGDSDGTYTIPKVSSGLKSYYVSQTGYAGPFGAKNVLTATGTGEDRFYVMALSDIDGKQNGTRYCWYAAAYSNMSDYATTTSTSFGSGKTNTANIVSKWNSSGYGRQNIGSYPDVWGAIQTQTAHGWFVPSQEEWSAFAQELGINKSNYQSFGLSDYYWSSSQYDNTRAWNADFDYEYMSYDNVDLYCFMRLSATF